VAADSIGISEDPSNNAYFANISRFYLMSNDTIATTTGSIPRIGNNWGVSFQINTTDYPSTASFQTDTREGASANDRAAFDDVASKVWPSGTLVRDIAYTATFTKQNIRNEGISVINMSVAEDWVKGPASSVTEGRDYTYIMAYGYDSQGNKRGAILSKRYISTQNGLDYYEAEVPESASYLSTFALVKLSGSGNPFQLITLTLAEIIGPPIDLPSSDGTEISVPVSVVIQNTTSPSIKTPVPLDTGRTAQIYLNAQGVVTQATTLQSTDGLASVSIREGIVAKNSTGAVLSSITIKSIPDGSVPGIPDGSAFTYAGMAYELQPDNSTFSPSISLSFTIPQAHWGQDFIVKTYDGKNNAWLDVPTSYNPDTGVVTSQVSHFCCFALFSKAVTPAPPAAVTTIPAPLPPAAIPPSPTALSVFSGILMWVSDMVIKNAVFVAGLIILAVAIFLYGRKRRRDRVMYLL
jgi:hypothetical protein